MVSGDTLLDLDSYGSPVRDILTLGDNRNKLSDNINVNMKMMMSAIPGVPGLDYPTLSTDDLLFIAAKTQFNCQRKEFGGIFYLHLRVLIKVTKYLSSSVPDCSQSPFWG